MSLSFYSNYIDNISQQPNSYWRELQQHIVDDSFMNTTLKRSDEHPLFEEALDDNNKFTFDFVQNNDCWVGTVTDSIVNADKDVNDYKEIYFKDCNHDSDRGRYYKFDNNYWINYENTSQEYESVSRCKVRRCNNWLKWVDDKGQFYEYPCVLEYNLMSPNNQVSKLITTANSHVTVIVQGNKDTHSLKKNDRFIFNGLPVKYLAINNYMQNDYVTKDTPLLFIEMYWDTIQDTDNLEENIADDVRRNYNIEILNGDISQIQGYETQLNVVVTFNGEKVVDDVELEWESSNTDVATVDKNGVLKLLGKTDKVATISVKIKGNSMATDSIDVEILGLNPLPTEEQLIVEPNITDIYLYSSKTVSAKVLSNGLVQNVEISCTPSGADGCYTILDNGNNSWTITNIKKSKEKLTLIFKYNDLTEIVEIQLRALY